MSAWQTYLLYPANENAQPHDALAIVAVTFLQSKKV
jgi:hypothetical protein